VTKRTDVENPRRIPRDKLLAHRVYIRRQLDRLRAGGGIKVCIERGEVTASQVLKMLKTVGDRPGATTMRWLERRARREEELS